MTTDAGVHEADYLVIALGADYDLGGDAGAGRGRTTSSTRWRAPRRLAAVIPAFSAGRALIGVCGAPFKCPPAPSECALLLDEELRRRGVRDACEIAFVIPLGAPVPPSPETSAALRGRVRRARDRADHRAADRRPRPRAQGRRCSTTASRAALRPLPRRAQAPGAGRRARERDRRGRLRPGRLRRRCETESPGRLRGRRRRHRRGAEGGRLRRGRRADRRPAPDRRGSRAARRRPATSARAPVTSSSASGRIGSVDIDFLSGPEPTGTFNPPSAERWRRRKSSAPAAAPAGSAAERSPRRPTYVSLGAWQ